MSAEFFTMIGTGAALTGPILHQSAPGSIHGSTGSSPVSTGWNAITPTCANAWHGSRA